MTLEKFDDVAWEDTEEDPVELLQLKHHKTAQGSLTNMSPDVWRTLKVWMDDPRLRDSNGPRLSIVTTATAPEGSAASFIRGEDRNVERALELLNVAAERSTEKTKTVTARRQWLAMTEAERLGIINRTYVLDEQTRIEDLDEALQKEVWLVAPKNHAPDFIAALEAWWLKVAVDLLRKARGTVRVNELKAKIDDIRDRFHPDNLVTIDSRISATDAMAQYGTRPFVLQMEWIGATPVMLRHALNDFHRAVTQTTQWLDRNLLEMSEFDAFKEALIDEWEIAFDDMIQDLPDDASDDDKRRAGTLLYRKLRESTAVQVRPRYTEGFYSRGTRHEIADGRSRGWHPDFETLVESLTIGNAK
ncbi:ABC-three component system protein [Arthrobacter tecti]